MNLAENLSRDFPQVVGEGLHQQGEGALGHGLQDPAQRRDVTLPPGPELVGQVHTPSSARVLPSGKVSFDAERNARGHDKFWAVALACQKEHTARAADRAQAGSAAR